MAIGLVPGYQAVDVSNIPGIQGQNGSVAVTIDTLNVPNAGISILADRLNALTGFIRIHPSTAIFSFFAGLASSLAAHPFIHRALDPLKSSVQTGEQAKAFVPVALSRIETAVQSMLAPLADSNWAASIEASAQPVMKYVGEHPYRSSLGLLAFGFFLSRPVQSVKLVVNTVFGTFKLAKKAVAETCKFTWAHRNTVAKVTGVAATAFALAMGVYMARQRFAPVETMGKTEIDTTANEIRELITQFGLFD